MGDIPNKITASFGITCDVDQMVKDNKKYIRIKVKKSKLPLNLHGRYYYRTGSVKKEITGFELTEFIIKSTGTSYDEMISDISREELTFESLKKIIDAYESEERYTEDLKPIFYTDGYNFFLTLWNLNYAYDKAQNKAQTSTISDHEYIL